MDKKKTAADYIKSKYIKNNKELKGLKILRVRSLEAIKSNLIEDHSLDELRAMRASAHASMESLKQISIVTSALFLFITIMFTMITAYNQSQLKYVDMSVDAGWRGVNVAFEEMDDLDSKLNLIKKIVELDMSSYHDATTESFQRNSLLTLFYFVMVIVGLIFVWRRFYLSYAIHNIIELDSDEKERSEKNKAENEKIRMERREQMLKKKKRSYE